MKTATLICVLTGIFLSNSKAAIPQHDLKSKQADASILYWPQLALLPKRTCFILTGYSPNALEHIHIAISHPIASRGDETPLMGFMRQYMRLEKYDSERKLATAMQALAEVSSEQDCARTLCYTIEQNSIPGFQSLLSRKVRKSALCIYVAMQQCPYKKYGRLGKFFQTTLAQHQTIIEALLGQQVSLDSVLPEITQVPCPSCTLVYSMRQQTPPRNMSSAPEAPDTPKERPRLLRRRSTASDLSLYALGYVSGSGIVSVDSESVMSEKSEPL